MHDKSNMTILLNGLFIDSEPDHVSLPAFQSKFTSFTSYIMPYWNLKSRSTNQSALQIKVNSQCARRWLNKRFRSYANTRIKFTLYAICLSMYRPLFTTEQMLIKVLTCIYSEIDSMCTAQIYFIL